MCTPGPDLQQIVSCPPRQLCCLPFLLFSWKKSENYILIQVSPHTHFITYLLLYESINFEYFNWIFQNTVIKTCFEILKSSEHDMLLSYKAPNLLECSEVFYLVPQFQFTIHPLALVIHGSRNWHTFVPQSLCCLYSYNIKK